MNWQQYWMEGLLLLFLGMGAWIDLKIREIPVVLLALFGIVGVLLNLVWNGQSIPQMFFAGAFGGFFLLLGRFTKEAVGYGDGLGIVVLGIFHGMQGAVAVVFTAFIFSGIYGAWKKIIKKAPGSERMPFYPFLFLAALGEVIL